MPLVAVTAGVPIIAILHSVIVGKAIKVEPLLANEPVLLINVEGTEGCAPAQSVCFTT